MKRAWKRGLALLMGASLSMSLLSLPDGAKAVYQDGTYEGRGAGRNGEIVLSVTITDGAISGIEVTKQKETPDYWALAKELPKKIIAANSVEIDGISGATRSSNGIKQAVSNALNRASGGTSGAEPEREPVVVQIDETIFAGGHGTQADPYRIETRSQLTAFAASLRESLDYSGRFIRLERDIDLSGESWTPIGGSFFRFDGDFDGGGHTISGLTEGCASAPRELDGSSAYIGLFGWLNEHAHIHDLTLSDVAIYTHSPGSAYVGGVAGRMSGTDTEGDYHGAGIDGCTVTGTIHHVSDKGTSFVGGVVGHMFKGSVINTMTDVTIDAAEKSGELIEAGGVAGLLNRGLIANCYALGDLTGSGYRNTDYDIEGMACLGNLAAVDGGTIVNCYGQGSVETLEYSIDAGIITGWVTGVGRAYRCWYNQDARMVIDGRTVSPVDPFGEVVPGGVSDEYFFHFPGALTDQIHGYRPSADAAKVAGGLNAAFAAFPVDIESEFGLAADALRTWTVENGQAVLSEGRETIHYVKPEVENLPEEPEPVLQDGTWYGRSEDKDAVVAVTVKGGASSEIRVLQGADSGEAYEQAVARARFKATFGDRTDYAPADPSRFAGGTGTAADPYRIETEAQLRYLAASINEDVDWFGTHFMQTADITVFGGDWNPIGWGIFADVDGDGFGQDAAALYPFRGSFDGGNHVIRGLRAGTETNPVCSHYMGLFGLIQGDYTGNELPADGHPTQLKNIRLEDVAFYTETRWRSYIGGLVANAQGGFLIDNCFVTGVIDSRSTEDFAFAGGLSGSLMYGGVTDCRTDVDATSYSRTNYSYVGGMSAVTNRATIVNSYALGNVHADADQTNRAEAGGFVGLDGGVCVNCYAGGDVESVSKYSMYVGGFAGMAASSSEHRQCYYNAEAAQRTAGNDVPDKRYAGKLVNESPEAAEQARTDLGADSFRALLESNRQSIGATLAQVRQALEADERGSSRYHSLYYNGDGSDLNPWVLGDGAAVFGLGLHVNLTAEGVALPDGAAYTLLAGFYRESGQFLSAGTAAVTVESRNGQQWVDAVVAAPDGYSACKVFLTEPERMTPVCPAIDLNAAR